MKKTVIIAEAGVNHNGSLELAKKLAWCAKDAGADFIKYQTFVAEKLAAGSAKKAVYQQANTGEGSQLEMLQKLSLRYEEFRQLKEYCDEIGIAFLSTPFELQSIAFLKTLNMPFWKIPSGEITNYPYLKEIARTGMPVVMSTGMATLEEVDLAVKTLKENGTTSLSLLHCTTQYPTPYADVNLRAMDTLKERFGLPVGYSDHTEGIVVPVAAVAHGAVIIEKHFTLDRNMEGPDHKASLEPQELAEMVRSIRIIETAMGDGRKMPRPIELGNCAVARKSIVAAAHISKGQMLTEELLTTKRPGDGISPMRWNEVLGKKANRNYQEDELIDSEVLDFV